MLATAFSVGAVTGAQMAVPNREAIRRVFNCMMAEGRVLFLNMLDWI